MTLKLNHLPPYTQISFIKIAEKINLLDGRSVGKNLRRKLGGEHR